MFLTKLTKISQIRKIIHITMIAIIISISLFTSILYQNNLMVLALENYTQQQRNNEVVQTSIPHNAKGHESHQIVNFQTPSEGMVYNGTVTFKASKPVDIIIYNEIFGLKNPKTKVWEINGKNYEPKILLKNVSEGKLKFEGSGLVAHSPSPEQYKITFAINDTKLNPYFSSLHGK